MIQLHCFYMFVYCALQQVSCSYERYGGINIKLLCLFKNNTATVYLIRIMSWLYEVPTADRDDEYLRIESCGCFQWQIQLEWLSLNHRKSTSQELITSVQARNPKTNHKLCTDTLKSYKQYAYNTTSNLQISSLKPNRNNKKSRSTAFATT